MRGDSWILEGAVIFLITFSLRLSQSVADLGFQAGGGRGRGQNHIFAEVGEQKRERKKFIKILSHLDKKFTFKLTRAKCENFFLTILLTFEWAPLK